MAKRIVYMLTEQVYQELVDDVCKALVVSTREKFTPQDVLKASFIFADTLAKYHHKFFGEEDHEDDFRD